MFLTKTVYSYDEAKMASDVGGLSIFSADSADTAATVSSKEGAHLPKQFYHLLVTPSLLPGYHCQCRAEVTVHSAK